MKIIERALNQSLLLNLVTILIFLAGILVAIDMKREAFPSVDFDVVSISAIYPGASPSSIEKYVAAPISSEIKKVNGLKKFETRNIEGLMIMLVTLDPDLSRTEKNQVVADLQRGLDRVRDLPAGLLERPQLRELKSELLPVVDVVISGEMPYADLREHGLQLKDRLENIPELSHLFKWGYREKEFWVVMNPQKMNRLNLSFRDIAQALKISNVALPGGSIKGSEGEVLVRTVGEVRKIQEIKNIVVRSNGSGAVIRVGDVADVRETFEERVQLHKSSGTEAIIYKVKKTRSGDIIKLVDQVQQIIDAYAAEVNDPRLKVVLLNDMSSFVRNRLAILSSNALSGVLLVLLVLFLFLSPGIASVTALGIPIAFLGAALLMNYWGTTVNLLSMFALVIVLGMVVDDAIIVAENIWSHFEQGKPPLQAAIDGTSEVFWPVTATILTTIAAFSPLLMVSGIFGRFIEILPIVVIACLIMSLLEAMFILPIHAFDVLKFRTRRQKLLALKKKPKLDVLKKAIAIYEICLRKVLRFRVVFAGSLVAILMLSFWLVRHHIPVILFPSEGIEQFFLRVDFPIGTSLEQSAKRMEPFEQVIKELPRGELLDYLVNVGVQQTDQADPFTQRGTHLAQLAVSLTPESDRSRRADDIIKSIRPRMEQIAEQSQVPRIYFVRRKQGPPVGKPVAVRVKGDELEQMKAVAEAIQKELVGHQGVFDINSNLKPGKKESLVRVDHAAAMKSLLSVESIAHFIRAAWSGSVVSYVRNHDGRIPIRLIFPESFRQNDQSLENLKIPNLRNQLVPLSNVAKIEEDEGVGAIFHHNGVRTITVTAAVDEEMTSSDRVNQALLPYLEGLKRQFPDVVIEVGGEWEDTTESLHSLAKAFGLSLTLIYMILVVLFRSALQPLVVMMAIPFSVIGVVWAFYAHGLPLSFFAMIGTIGLAGVVVNDSIVLVDFLNQKAKEGVTMFEAAVSAGKRRFRAVWLTTLTTVFGLLPVVYGIGGMDRFLRPSAMALSYGLLVGTFLILFLVPALCLIHHDLSQLWARLWKKLRFNWPISMENPDPSNL